MNEQKRIDYTNIVSENELKFLEDKEYESYIDDLIHSEVVLSMKKYIQHGTTTCLDHCINVSYYGYRLAKAWHLDAKAVARGALLHDFFLYDWHLQKAKWPLHKKHGFTHPQIALENAEKYFNLTKKEKDIISKHMWPLTIFHIPRYRESFVVTLADKYCSVLETFGALSSQKVPANITH